MNPLDRSLTPPSPQQEVQANTPEQADALLQANIMNIGGASNFQPATIPVAASASQFAPVPSYPHLVQSLKGDLFQILNSLNEQVTQQVNEHRVLLHGIHIPIFRYQLRMNYMLSRDRLILQRFIQEVFKRLENLTCHYNREKFISSLLLQADRQHLVLEDRHHLGFQVESELEKIIETYIPNPSGDKYLQSDRNIDWPDSQYVRENQDMQKAFVDSITPEIKKRVYLKTKELNNLQESLLKGKYIKRIHYIDAAFAYGAPPSVIRTWVTKGKKLYHDEKAKKQLLRSAQQVPRAAEQHSSPSAEISLVPEQPQAAAFIPGIVINDDQRPGPSRGSRTPLRFEPYKRSNPEVPLIDPSIQTQAATLGLTAETLQAFNLGIEPDAAFNTQMEALSWPRVTSSHFVQEQSTGRYVIMPASRTAIGRFIIENCPADARVYNFAALRYGVSLAEVVQWASEAGD